MVVASARAPRGPARPRSPRTRVSTEKPACTRGSKVRRDRTSGGAACRLRRREPSRLDVRTSGAPGPLLCPRLDMHGLAVVLLLALPLPFGPQKEKDPDAALLPLAAGLRAYVEARAGGTGPDAARTAVAQRLEELSRARGGEPLQNPAELGRALWLARGYQESKERGGKVQSATFASGSFPGAGLEYAYRLPREYDPKKAYPLILSLAAEGE